MDACEDGPESEQNNQMDVFGLNLESPNSQPSLCDKCIVQNKQLRLMRERIESLELRNIRLHSECSRLQEELREAQFKGRSRARSTCPVLPDEILQNIFAYATHLEGGLVSPHWRTRVPKTSYEPWIISSRARRSIPLVCRKWYALGMKYLFQHIVLFSGFHLCKLLHVLVSATTTQVNWIRGLELILSKDEVDTRDEGVALVFNVRTLILAVPQGRLRAFGFEDECCDVQRERHWHVSSIILDVLRRFGAALELLHLPCLDAISQYGTFNLECQVQGINPASLDLFNVKTLSLTEGCNPTFCSSNLSPLFGSNHHSLQTVFIGGVDYHHANLFLTAKNIHTICIMVHRSLALSGVDLFLGEVPGLRHLIITPLTRYATVPTPLGDNIAPHVNLEEITLCMDSASSYQTIFALNPIFIKIEIGCFPALKRVVIRGPYPEGYIDYIGICSEECSKCWKDARKACINNGIEFLDEQEKPLYRWHTRFSDAISENMYDEESTSSSEPNRQYETDFSGFCGSSTADDDEDNSDDSGGSRYRYVPRPDLDYDTDSGNS